MRPVLAEQCGDCVHFTGFKKKVGTPTCEAFPDGIPLQISIEEHDHRKPFPSDKGIRFEPNPTIAAGGA